METDSPIKDVATAADVRRTLRQLLGPGAEAENGLLHVVATAHRLPLAPRVLAVGPHAPKSNHDFFLLNAARARAEAIVTTAAILRAEPNVHYGLQGPPRVVQALRAYRAALGLRSSPLLVVMSAGASFETNHPALKLAAQVVLVAPDAQASRARAHQLPGSTLLPVPEGYGPGRALAGALRRLATQRAIRNVTLEAGPSVAADFYATSGPPDALWLSRCVPETGQFAPQALGPELKLGKTPPEQLFREASQPAAIHTAGFSWFFQRFAEPHRQV